MSKHDDASRVIFEQIPRRDLEQVTGAESNILTNWKARGFPTSIEVRGKVAGAFFEIHPGLPWAAFLGLPEGVVLRRAAVLPEAAAIGGGDMEAAE